MIDFMTMSMCGSIDYCTGYNNAIQNVCREYGWVSVKDRLPESGKEVLVCVQSKTFEKYRKLTVAVHIGEKEKTTEDDYWQDCECETEYDKENDCYWIKECWYETNVVDDNPNWIIDGDYIVTHWMPLPGTPTKKEDEP